MECKGFLFDLDGTLVDSLPAVERAWTHWAERRGVNPQAVLDFIHGKQAITSLRHFMPGESEAEIQREFELLEQAEAQDTDGVRAMPGAIALLERLNALGILGRSSPQVRCRWPALAARPAVCRSRRCSSPPSRLNTVSHSPTPICWAPSAGACAARVRGG